MDLDPDPFAQFQRWYAEAAAAGVAALDAMTVATADARGRPSARTVLLKGVDERGFVFFTNYDSHKGRELAVNPHAALVLYWPELHRQVRVTGRVERVAIEESAAYFRTRPLGSRIGAWVSRQSEVIPGREDLERRFRELAAQYGDGEVPLPPHWGGCRVVPDSFEFWQSRPNRLHDRLLYSRLPDGRWRREWLSP